MQDNSTLSPLVITNALAPGGAPTELFVQDGRIAALGPGASNSAPPDAERFDAKGRLILPGLVEGHVHLDKTFVGLPFIPHIEGATIADRIAAEKSLRRSVPASIEARGGRLIEMLSAFGTVAARSHVDIDTDVGLSGLEALLRLKQTTLSASTCRSSLSRNRASSPIPASPTCSKPPWERRRPHRRPRPGGHRWRSERASRRRLRPRRAVRRRRRYSPARCGAARCLGAAPDRGADSGAGSLGPGRRQPRVLAWRARRRRFCRDRGGAGARRRRDHDDGAGPVPMPPVKKLRAAGVKCSPATTISATPGRLSAAAT